jgi:hypothetical protein
MMEFGIDGKKKDCMYLAVRLATRKTQLTAQDVRKEKVRWMLENRLKKVRYRTGLGEGDYVERTVEEHCKELTGHDIEEYARRVLDQIEIHEGNEYDSLLISRHA